MSTESNIIVVYGTTWCYESRRAKTMMEENKIPFSWIDIDRDMEGRRFVEQVNKGNRSVPTIVFPDGTILVEPKLEDLKSKLGLQIR